MTKEKVDFVSNFFVFIFFLAHDDYLIKSIDVIAIRALPIFVRDVSFCHYYTEMCRVKGKKSCVGIKESCWRTLNNYRESRIKCLWKKNNFRFLVALTAAVRLFHRWKKKLANKNVECKFLLKTMHRNDVMLPVKSSSVFSLCLHTLSIFFFFLGSAMLYWNDSSS